MAFINNYPDVTASGDTKTANRKLGQFEGTVVAFEELIVEKYPKMRAKLVIKVDGESDDFEDVINFSQDTRDDFDRSLHWYQAHVKRAMLSAGKNADFSEEWTLKRCDNECDNLVGCKVKFTQSLKKNSTTGKGLDIDYIK